MKTEVSKSFKWGFVLSEQEMRRIIQACQDHISKLELDSTHHLISATLHDGSIVESAEIGEVLSLENNGSKAVKKLKVVFDDGKEKSDRRIEVQYQDGLANPDGWTSINYTITGPSRDWAFLAASEIEERVRRTKTAPITYVVASRWFMFAPLFVFFIGSMIGMNYLLIDKSPGTLLETAYKNGTIRDPIEALIFLEKTRAANHIGLKFVGFMIGMFAIPVALAGTVYFLLPRLYPSYNFYWGDYMARYDKRKSNVRILWTVVVLGILVSLVAGLLLRII